MRVHALSTIYFTPYITPNELGSGVVFRFGVIFQSKKSGETMQVENSGGGGGGAGAGFDRRPEKEEEEKVIDRVIESSPDDRRRLYLPPGYRFHPNDDELICGYLLPKMQNTPLPWNHIKDVNLYDYNPEELAGLSIM